MPEDEEEWLRTVAMADGYDRMDTPEEAAEREAITRALMPYQVEAMAREDDEAYAFYADPANLVAAGPGMRRTDTFDYSSVGGERIRFPDDLIAAVKVLADQDGYTVSSWIRQVIRTEVARRA